MTKSDLIDIACKVLHETDKAWLINDGTRKAWIPKSWAELEPQPDGTAILTISEAKALDKELI